MLENVTEIFDIMCRNMWKLKKKTYEQNMTVYREKYNHYFEEMVDYVMEAEDKNKAAREVADIFTDAVFNTFSKRGKIKGVMQADLNFAMIYYVFPAIQLVDNENAKLLCDEILAVWKTKFKDSDKLTYSTYQAIYDGFNEKILGIF